MDWFLGGCSVVEIDNWSPIDFSLENREVSSYPPHVVPAGFLAGVDLGVALHGLSSDREDRNIVGEFLAVVLDVLVVLFWTAGTGSLFFALRYEAVAASAG